MDGNLCSDPEFTGSFDVVDTEEETNFIINTTVTPEIFADQHSGWNHFIANEEVGYICEQEGKNSFMFCFL